MVDPSEYEYGAVLPRRRAVRFELAIMLAFFMGTSLVSGMIAPASLYDLSLANWQANVLYIVSSLTGIALILFVLRMSGDSMARFGIARLEARKDLPALGAAVAAAAMYVGIMWALRPTGGVAPDDNLWSWLAPSGAVSWMTGIVCLLTSAAYEEILMRGYAIPRMTEVCGGRGPALALSSSMFALSHLYQGPAGVLWTGLLGLAYGSVFLITGRLWPLVVGHALTNIVLFCVPIW